MTSFHWFCFSLVIFCLSVWASAAQSMIRTLIPMTVMETHNAGSTNTDDCSTTDELSALLLLARALEIDRANSANNGIDVNGLLNTLINALVYTATQGGRGYASGHNPDGHRAPNYPNMSPGNNNNRDPLLDLQLLPPGKDNVATLSAVGDKVLGIGLLGGDDSSRSSGSGGILEGVLDTVI